MTPFFLNLTSDDHQLIEKRHDQGFISPCQNDVYSSCSATYVNTTTSGVDHHHQDGIETNYNTLRDHQQEEKVFKNIWHDDESGDHQLFSTSSTNPETNVRFTEIKSAVIFGVEMIDHGGSNSNNNGSGLTEKWTSSKMRIMRKMMNSDNEQQKYHDHQPQQEQNGAIQMNYVLDGSDGGFVRVCSSCNTTKTPLWRGGPSGPKSLCNACGIRQRKARRAREAAAAAMNETIVDSTTTPLETSSSSSSIKPIKKTIIKIPKKSRTNNNYYVAQYNKKQCKLFKDHEENIVFKNTVGDHIISSDKKLCFDDFSLELLTKNSGLRGVLAQDEEEGAVLLMALSCGLV